MLQRERKRGKVMAEIGNYYEFDGDIDELELDDDLEEFDVELNCSKGESADEALQDENTKQIVDSITFDDIIGYEKIKKQLKQILGYIKNPEPYKKLGVQMPKGIFLVGDPGLGKTMLASAFVNASGLPSYVLHRIGDDSSFPLHMEEVFEEASEKAPSVILLDDMDKFSGKQRDRSIFNTLQSLIDSVRDKEVYIIATANEESMPSSLLRPGRFDFHIDVEYPSVDDMGLLMSHFLEGKPISSDISPDDIASAISTSSPIKIKTTINKAVMVAASKGENEASVEDFLEAFLEIPFEDGEWKKDHKRLEETAYHEAGHAVVAEACVKGSVGFVSAISSRDSGGQTVYGPSQSRRRPHFIVTALAGKAAVENCLPYMASGCRNDIGKARSVIKDGITDSALYGYEHILQSDDDTQTLGGAKLKYYEDAARRILNTNKGLFDAMVAILMDRGYLLHSDIARLEETYPVDNSMTLALY